MRFVALLVSSLLVVSNSVSARPAECKLEEIDVPRPITPTKNNLQCLERQIMSLKSTELSAIAIQLKELEAQVGKTTEENRRLRLQLDELKDDVGLPKGAVIAFDRPDGCPKKELGWREFVPGRDRFILGVGKRTLPYVQGVPKYTLSGEEKHKLSIEEIPKHSHGGFPVGNLDGRKAGMLNEPAYHVILNKRITPEGGGRPHNNMPPFVVLYWCIRQ